MFDLVIFIIGAVVTAILGALKLADYLTLGWLGVFIPLIVAVAIVLIKHGVDIGDFLPD